MNVRRGALARAQGLFLHLSLHRRIAAFVASILLAVFVAFGYVGWEAVNRSTERTLEERYATTLVVARHLDVLIGHAHTHLLVIAGELASRGEGLQPNLADETLQHSLDQVRFFFAHLLVFDADGRPVTTMPAAPPLDLTPEVQAFLERSLRRREPGISDLLRLPTDGSPGVLFTAPVVREGRLLGVVAAEMRLPHPSISSIVGALELGQSGHMEVVDGRGWILSSTSPDDVFKPSEHGEFYGPLLGSRIRTVGRALYEEHHDEEGAEEEAEHHDEASRWHIMAFVPLEQAPWGVGLGQTEHETFIAPRELRDRTLSVAAVAFMLALLFAWAGTRSVVDPIRALTRAGERMATGDLSQPIHVAQPDEIGRLGHVLEGMRQRLRQSVEEIRGWNRELEQRVQERTGELEVSNRHLQALLAVTTAASGGTSRDEVLEVALRELVETLGATCGWAFLWDEAQRHLRLAADYRVPERLRVAEMTVDCPDAICVMALQAPGTLTQPHVECPALPPDATAALRDCHCWCAPIRAGGQTLGSLCLSTRGSVPLADDQRALLEAVARQVAVAFENARLTEETARLEAARRMELLRAEFLASVSHELRTPLGFIKGYTTTLLRTDVAWDPGQQTEFLQIVDEETDRLTELVDSLLDAGRVQAGRLRLQLQPVDPARVIQRSVERMNGALRGHPLNLDLGPAPAIEADPGRLEQVVVNLVQNAVKYSSDGAPIDVRLAADDQEVRISILDRGVGLTPAEAERIFEPFFRVSNTTTSRVGGAGLGLAICRAIVEAHGGRVWAEPRPGGGTAVHVALPRLSNDIGGGI